MMIYLKNIKTNTKILVDIQNDKEVIKEIISYKQCTSRFIDKHRLKYHMTDEHIIKCTLCHLTFKSNTRLQDHEHILHSKQPPDIESAIDCKYCEFICSEQTDTTLKYIYLVII